MTMKLFHSYFLMIALAIPAIAQTPPHYTFTVPPKNVSRFAWTKEKWQGDDKPYKVVRTRIEQALQAGKSPANLIAQYKNAYQQKPADNLRLFAWVCSLVFPRMRHIQDTDFEGLQEAFEKSAAPHTYEFMRMRFLSVEQYGGGNDYTTALGERLYAQNKDDTDVIYYLWANICTNTLVAKEKSLGYARRLIELDPNRGTGYICMADRYYDWWASYGKNPEDARQCIYWSQEYLKHETRLGKRYEQTKEYSKLAIAKLQKWLAEHK